MRHPAVSLGLLEKTARKECRVDTAGGILRHFIIGASGSAVLLGLKTARVVRSFTWACGIDPHVLGSSMGANRFGVVLKGN